MPEGVVGEARRRAWHTGGVLWATRKRALLLVHLLPLTVACSVTLGFDELGPGGATGAGGSAGTGGTPPDTPDYPDPMAGVSILTGRTTVNVGTSAELNAALGAAVAGQTIQLGPGTYAGNFTLDRTSLLKTRSS
jgi:hypothetical protein